MGRQLEPWRALRRLSPAPALRAAVGRSSTGGRRNISYPRGTQLQNFQFWRSDERLFVSRDTFDQPAEGLHRVSHLQAEPSRPRLSGRARNNDTERSTQIGQFDIAAVPSDAPENVPRRGGLG